MCNGDQTYRVAGLAMRKASRRISRDIGSGICPPSCFLSALANLILDGGCLEGVRVEERRIVARFLPSQAEVLQSFLNHFNGIHWQAD